MAGLAAIRIFVIALSLLVACNNAVASAPIVYEDEYIAVRAGLPSAGSEAVHIGDPLSLIVDIVFDPDRIQVENIDDEFFQRAFSATPDIRLYAPGTISTRKESPDQVRVTAEWRLHVLDCPADLTSCPGSRTYELPVMSIGYQLASSSGNSADSRAARFRPWPGTISIASAIALTPDSDTTLTDVMPGGAYDKLQPVSPLAPARFVLLGLGALILLAGFFANPGANRPRTLLSRSHDADSRWEQSIKALQNDTLSDEEWSDLLRRCITWYCVDELGRNPYAWLGARAGDAAARSDATAGARDYFVDVLHQQSIEPTRRVDYLDRLIALTGYASNANAAAMES